MNSLEYEVRESARAKHVRLKVSLYDASLVVVIPTGFDPRCIPEVLREKRSWIERVRREVVEQRRRVESEPSERWPERVRLRAIEEEWWVQYRQLLLPSVGTAEAEDYTLLVQGNVHDAEACRAALGDWVRVKAQRYLVSWLRAMGEAQQLPVGRVVVKAQRTCWATCSRGRTININRKLLFLPARLVEYVFLHELCHTVHLDHSAKFWSLVGARLPEYRKLDVELRTAWRYVPVWLGRQGPGARD